MSNLVKLQYKFKDLLNQFVEQLIELFPLEGDLVVLQVLMAQQSAGVIISHIVKKVLPYKDQIKQRDEKFFIESDGIFNDLVKSDVNHFKQLWMSPDMADDDKEAIWQWIDVFVVLSEKYQVLE